MSPGKDPGRSLASWCHGSGGDHPAKRDRWFDLLDETHPMHLRTHRLIGIAGPILCWLLAAACVSATSPRLSHILPRGVRRGADHVLTFHGSRLADAQEIFFYEPGLETVEIKAESDAVVRATVRVADDCALGQHTAQVRTASGISDFRTVWVGALPVVEEAEPNNQFEAPQSVSLDVTVQGIIENEDVDYFAVDAKAGQRLSVEVEGMRLATTLFDPYVAILNDKRFELAASDDSPLVQQDAVAGIVVPDDGRYFIELRESAYGGNGNCRYRLHIGTFPRPTGVYPAGGPAGTQVAVRFVGDPKGDIEQTVTLPAEPTPDFGLVASDAAGAAPSLNPFRVVACDNVLEAEPNDSPAEAVSAELPRAFNGILHAAGDVDHFQFGAQKGQVLDIECYARRQGSPVDAVVHVLDASGKTLAGNDDSRGPDSYLRFKVPADGNYVVRVSDHLQRGGPDFVYRVEVQQATAGLTLGIPRVERYGQYRQTVSVPRGNRFATLVSASRRNFSGDLVLEETLLPDGIRMTADPMPANLNVMPVMFEAAADAPLNGKLVDFIARHADDSQDIHGRFVNQADLVLGPPNQSVYRRCEVERLAMAVVQQVPFQLEIVPPKVPLVRNGSLDLKITVRRDEGFTAPIRLEFPFRPPGVGTVPSVTIPEGKNEVVYPLNANSNAQLGPWKVYAIGSADVGGAAWASTQLAPLTIAEPLVTAEMARSACEQGQAARILCTLNHIRPFEGTAKAQLLGLPAKVTAADVPFDSQTAEIVFDVATEPSSPAGTHRNILCRVTVIQNGEPIVSRAGTTELQIDKPLPAPQKKTAPVARAPAENKPAAKPLSRLEKLRLEARQRKARQNADKSAGGD